MSTNWSEREMIEWMDEMGDLLTTAAYRHGEEELSFEVQIENRHNGRITTYCGDTLREALREAMEGERAAKPGLYKDVLEQQIEELTAILDNINKCPGAKAEHVTLDKNELGEPITPPWTGWRVTMGGLKYYAFDLKWALYYAMHARSAAAKEVAS